MLLEGQVIEYFSCKDIGQGQRIVGQGSKEQAREIGGESFYFYGNVAINILRSPKINIFTYTQVISFYAN